MTNKLLVFITLILLISLPSFGMEYGYGTVEDAYDGQLVNEEDDYNDDYENEENDFDTGPTTDDMIFLDEVCLILPATTQYIGNMKIVVSANLQRSYSGRFRDTVNPRITIYNKKTDKKMKVQELVIYGRSGNYSGTSLGNSDASSLSTSFCIDNAKLEEYMKLTFSITQNNKKYSIKKSVYIPPRYR